MKIVPLKNTAAVAMHFSILASFILGRKVTVVITDDPSYVGYTSAPVNGVMTIVLSCMTSLYREQDGTPMSDLKRIFCMQGVLVHECLHLKFTSFSEINKQLLRYSTSEDKKEFAKVNNIVEDPAIEYASPSVVGGALLKALDFIIRHTWLVSIPIDQEVVEECEEACAYAQILSALIQVGDRGAYKGEFSSDLARDTFAQVLPIFNKAVVEPVGAKRVHYSVKIFDVLQPLLQRQRAMQDKIQKMVDSIPQLPQMTDGTNNGEDGEDLPQDTSEGEGKSDNKAAKKRKTLEEKVLEEAAKRQARKETSDSENQSGSGAESETTESPEGGDENQQEQSGGKSDGKTDDDSEEKSSSSGSEKTTQNDSEKKSEGTTKENSCEKSDKTNDKSKGKSKDSPDKESEKDGEEKSGKKKEGKSSGKGKEDESPEYEKKAEEISRGESDKEFKQKDIEDESVPEITDDDFKELESGIEQAQDKIKEEEAAELARKEAETRDIPKDTEDTINVKDDAPIDALLVRIYEKIRNEYALKIDALARSLKEIFKGDVGAVKYSSHGSRISMKRVASPILHSDVMEKRIGPKDLSNMAICLLVDESGSMGQSVKGKSNYECARETAICLYEALSQLNIPVCVTGFTTSRNKSYHRHFVTWHSPKSDKYRLSRISANNSNYDGIAISCAHEILVKSSAKHKLLIVLSDGAPCPKYFKTSTGTLYVDGKIYTKAAIDEARKDSSVFGVALNCTDEKEYNYMYGKDYIKVSTAKDIFLPIVEALKTIVKNW